MWLLLNSAGRCSAAADQVGSSSCPNRGPEEAAVGALHVLDALGVPPHHEVAVGPHAGDVVDPARHDPLGLELGEELLDLLGHDVALVAERRGHGEDGPHGVADGVVDLADPGRGGLAGHGPILPRPRWRSSGGWRRPPRRRDRCRCRPVCRRRRRRPRPAPARAGRATAARTRATRERCPTAYCGSPPPHRCTWASSSGVSGRSMASPTSRTARRTSSSSGLCRSASSPALPD